MLFALPAELPSEETDMQVEPFLKINRAQQLKAQALASGRAQIPRYKMRVALDATFPEKPD